MEHGIQLNGWHSDWCLECVVARGINAALKTHPPVPTILLMSFACLCLLLPISRLLSEVLLNRLGQWALYRLRIDLCRQILASPLRQVEKIGSARLLAVLTEDLPNIASTILAVPLLCINIAVVVSCLAYMGYLSWVLLLILLGFIAVGVSTFRLPVAKAQYILELARRDSDAMQLHFNSLTGGIKELKIHSGRRNEFLNHALEKASSSFRDNNIRGMTIYNAAASWGQALMFIIVGVIIFGLPVLRQMEPQSVTGYAIALLYIMSPLQMIVNMTPVLGRANVALKKVEELGLALASCPVDEVGSVPSTSLWQTLQFQSVTHSYAQAGDINDFILGPVDLSFSRGESVFITGGNGAGKTTLAKLLIGLYAPEQGFISLDGRPIDTPEQREQYRQRFSVIFSDFCLFNTLLGISLNPEDDRANEYLRKLNLANRVKIRDDGTFSTVELSQGQRKRLALFTACLEDRQIYVFDEWAAEQDSYFKEVFYGQLIPELRAKGKTVIVITHDEEYYHTAGRIIELRNGQVFADSLKPQPRDLQGGDAKELTPVQTSPTPHLWGLS